MTEKTSDRDAAAEVARARLLVAASRDMSREARHPRIDLVPGLAEAGEIVTEVRLHVAATARALEAQTVSPGTCLEQSQLQLQMQLYPRL
jgi:hypothetical protein